jgi:hypothetical protein
VGTLKGVGRIYQQTFLDTYSKVAFTNLWLAEYNERRTHQGRYCFGKTPMQTFFDAPQLARDKQLGGDTHDRQAA